MIYPQAKAQKPGIGFPVMRAVAMISLPTVAVVDFAFTRIAGKGTGGNLLRVMIPNMKRGDVIVADRLHPAYVTVGGWEYPKSPRAYLVPASAFK